MQLLKHQDIKSKIKKAYFLFPALEGLRDTIGFSLVTHMVIPYFPFFMFLTRLVHFLPFVIRLFLFKVALKILGLPDYMITPSLRIIHPRILPNIVYLCADEEIHIKDIDYEFLEKNKELIRLVYGRTDPFVPKQNYYRLKERITDVDAIMTDMNHGFMIRYDKKMAELLSVWIKECS